LFYGSATPRSQGANPSAPTFWWFSSIFMSNHLMQNDTFGKVTHVGRGVLLGVGHASHSKRGGAFPQCVGVSPIFMSTLFNAERSRSSRFLGSATPPVPRGTATSFPNTWGFLCVRRGNTYGEVHVLGSQPRHCILHSASRNLSAIAEFLVELRCRKWYRVRVFSVSLTLFYGLVPEIFTNRKPPSRQLIL